MADNKKVPPKKHANYTDIISKKVNKVNLNNGFIKLYRSLSKWEWYKDANTMRLFIHCLINANHKDVNYKGLKIKTGSFITGRYKLAQELGISEQKIRTAILHLKSTKEITIKSTKKYSIISINNWDLYQQNNQEITDNLTINQPSDNHITRNKEYKEIKESPNQKGGIYECTYNAML